MGGEERGRAMGEGRGNERGREDRGGGGRKRSGRRG